MTTRTVFPFFSFFCAFLPELVNVGRIANAGSTQSKGCVRLGNHGRINYARNTLSTTALYCTNAK